MKNYKKILCGALTAVMVLVLALAVVPVSAAAKPVLNKTKLTLNVGNSSTLSVKNAGKSKIIWSSNKKTIVTVNKNGKVTAKSVGKAVVSAKLKKTGNTIKCNVTVKPAKEENKKENKEELKAQDITALLAGKTYKGIATAMGTTMDAFELSFNADGMAIGKILDFDIMGMKDVAGTFTATLKGKTVTLTIKDADGAIYTKVWTVVKDDFSELSETIVYMGMDIPVEIMDVTE